jgi:hypothetical protein
MRRFAFVFVLLFVSACDQRSVVIDRIGAESARFDGLSYYLPRGIVELTIARKKKKEGSGESAPIADTVTLTVSAVRYVPDPSHHYAIKIRHDPFFTDKIVVQVGRTGLLESISTDGKDETGEILRRLARAPADIFSAPEQPRAASNDGNPNYQEYEIKFSLDPTDNSELNRLRQVLRKIDPTIKFIATPLVRVATRGGTHQPDCNIDPCFRVAVPYALELVSDPYNHVVRPWKKPEPVAAAPDAKPKKPPADSEAPNTVQRSTQTESTEGRDREGSITATAPAETGLVIARAVVVLPNKNLVGQIALTRAPFVQKKFNLTFNDGFLTKADLDNPSEALAFVQIPIDVAKAIVSIPSAMFDFKVREIQSDNKLLLAQKQNLEYQKQIIDAQKALIASK